MFRYYSILSIKFIINQRIAMKECIVYKSTWCDYRNHKLYILIDKFISVCYKKKTFTNALTTAYYLKQLNF